MDPTKNRPTARCLDLTRLVSRIGRGPWTGIDRVEYEYLRALIADDVPLFSVVRIFGGLSIFKPGKTEKLFKRLSRQDSSEAAIFGRSKAGRIRELSVIAGLASGWMRKEKIHFIVKYLPAGLTYINVGHSNLSPEIFDALRGIQDCRKTVMLHDTIPLDFPQLQRPETVQGFAEKLQIVAEQADLILCNSESTRADLVRHLPDHSPLTKIQVAHLGVRIADATPSELPPGLCLTDPYFVAIGTIEPRKLHSFLLDIWEGFSSEADVPHLFVIGQRGWKNKSVFERLDRKPDNVTELGNLSDGAVTAILQKARGLLFPSLAEGFGMPAVEAAKLNVPVICNNLSVFREILGEYPIYADTMDMYDWETKIRKLANNSELANNRDRRAGPEILKLTWEEHFNQVLRVT